MTKAEAIFFNLVNQAATPDLKAKKLLFDTLIKLQHANICHPHDRLPEVQLDEDETGATNDVSAAIDRVTAAMGRDAAAPVPSADPPLEDAKPGDSAPELAESLRPPR